MLQQLFALMTVSVSAGQVLLQDVRNLVEVVPYTRKQRAQVLKAVKNVMIVLPTN